jgi:hypothetical protein
MKFLFWRNENAAAQPKEEPLFIPAASLAQIAIEEMNALERHHIGNARTESERVSNLIVGDRVTQLQRRILHDYDQIPIYRNGRWELFEREHE